MKKAVLAADTYLVEFSSDVAGERDRLVVAFWEQAPDTPIVMDIIEALTE